MDLTKYKIVSTSSKGRGLFSSQNLEAEEVILEESPLVSSQFSWNKAYGYLACEHCLFPLESSEQNIRRLTFDSSIILPHPECDPSKNIQETAVQCLECSTKFCSLQCLLSAQKKYHKLICQQPQLELIDEIWKKVHYPPETASVLLILKIFSMMKIQPDLVKAFDEFCSRSTNEDLSLCHKLLGERFTNQISELHQAIAQAFADDEILHKYITLDGLTQIFAMIGTNSQGIGTSSFAGWVKNVSDNDAITDKQRVEIDAMIDSYYVTLEETAGQFLNNEGSGLYLTQSKINHSCRPNAEIRFPYSNNLLQVVALRDITADEEICISYLDECQINRSRHSRQRRLQENYLFLCDCEKCQEEINQPDVTSDEEENDEMETDDDSNIRV